jgi:hypothetical protein
MTDTNEISELIADVREQVVYFKELGVELLDVKMDEFDAAEMADVKTPMGANNAETNVPSVDEIPRDLPDLTINLPRVDMPKPNLKKQSKLSGLPSLANRAPVRNGNSCRKKTKLTI